MKSYRKALEYIQYFSGNENRDILLEQTLCQDLKLRSAHNRDCKLLWKWASEPNVRLHSFSSNSISWNEHINWFSSKLKASNCKLYIAMNKQYIPIGVIRYDLGQSEATVSITIGSQYRGLGYGSKLISLASSTLLKTSDIRKINAYIQPENQTSVRAFLKAGFQLVGTVILEDKNDADALHLIKTS